VDRASRPENRL